MKVLLIQPPLVQLNSPYPSGAYLSAFFKEMGCQTRWLDLSISLFYKIFSARGLSRLFELTSDRALKMADDAQKSGDEGSAFNLRRYVSSAPLWIKWIDVITGILRGAGREKEHEFLFSPYAPRGNRMENFLGGLGREPSVDDVRFLCSYALADLADYITAVFDENFSLVRYAESLTVDESSFSDIEKKVDSPVMKEFYRELLEEKLSDFNRIFQEAGETSSAAGAASTMTGHSSGDENFLVGISVPFAGTFMAALYTARFIKEKFGDRAYIVLGGGFVNTELREVKEARLYNYIDAISYDRGYGGFYEFLKGRKGIASGREVFPATAAVATPATAAATATASWGDVSPIYKFRQFFQNSVIEPDWTGSKEIVEIENSFTRKIVPDFSDIDFSIYPRLCDDKNPMQRMWSDGTWIKAYLAHGCYWHKCAFCDTQLDYVCGYQLTDVEKLYRRLADTASQKQVYGLHFVDEALPPAALKKFALLNAGAGEEGDTVERAGSPATGAGGTASTRHPLYYWGNVRFEKSFTYDLAALLSYGGLGGVSAGLEVATGDGLKNINKGTDIDSIVSACAAFKENGILVHAYMIYGFWNDTAQNIINSMETLRQFFEAGLLDSAFWHKFILTKNSRVMDEWKRGLHPELKPIFPAGKSIFAGNCLHFEGEKRFAKWGRPLDAALSSWMQGRRLEQPVRKWFDFDVPSPAISKDFIQSSISRYEKRKSAPAKEIDGREIYWLGSRPVNVSAHAGKTSSYTWFYMQEMQEENFSQETASLLWNLRPPAPTADRKEALLQIKKSPELQNLLQKLRGIGLVII